MKIKKSTGNLVFNIVAYAILAITALFCVLPFILIISGSFTDNQIILLEGYSLLPKKFTTAAYELIFKAPQEILNAYKVTLYCTILGTVLGLLIITLTGYVLSRKEFKYRNRISFMIYFTTIFGGGMIPWYLTISKILGMQGKMIALWFPGLMSPFLIILMRTFIFSSVPDAITESAKIDGAGHVTIFSKIVMPVLGPGLATVGLFLALSYWNDWYRSSLFSTNKTMYELQFYLYNLLNQAKAIREMSQNASVPVGSVPSESTKLAMAVVVTGPILLLYPFVQRYFVSGITVGAVKG